VKQKQLYKLVADHVAENGDRQLLDCAIEALRGIDRAQAQLSELKNILAQEDALGKIYQAINAPALESAYRATTQQRRKFSDAEIPAVTQLFTPRFVVEFLLSHTLGRRRDRPVRDLRVLDPACGTMNFGVVAVEMLDAMYREELSRLGPDRASVSSEREIPAAILKHNLFGIDIDPIALDLAAHTLSIKLKVPVEQCRVNLWLGDALFDREIQNRCDGGFDVIVTNPPYLSARNLPPARVSQLKRRYPAAWRDAYACFIESSLELVKEGGYVGILAMQSFMFTMAFEKLRRRIAERACIDTIAHFGPGLFDIGNPGTLQTSAIVLRKESEPRKRDRNEVIALRLVDADDKEAALKRALSDASAKNRFRLLQHDLIASPRAAWVYWMTPRTREVFQTFPKLGAIAEPRQGLATTDNARFVRYWWEIAPTRADAPCRASPNKWIPYVKSGRFRRWYESPRHRVNWADDGREIKQSIAERYPYLKGRWEWVAKNSQFYGRGGITYSYLTSGLFSARLMPAGAIFDVAGSALFPEDALTILAVLNSTVASDLLGVINPTVNFQVGDLSHLPVPSVGDENLHRLAACAVEIQKTLDTFDETSPDFVSPPSWKEGSRALQAQLGDIERQIDAAVATCYGMERPVTSHDIDCSSEYLLELARRWVSFAIGRLLGRWGCERELETIHLDSPVANIVDRIRSELSITVGASEASEIEHCVDGIEAFLSGGFYPWHVKLYRARPVYLVMNDRLMLHDFATADLIGKTIDVPRGWERCVDDGIQLNMTPLSRWVRDRTLSKTFQKIETDLNAGRYDWSSTARTRLTPALNRECASKSARLSRAVCRAPAKRR
jgi:N-6 DNA Methylase